MRILIGPQLERTVTALVAVLAAAALLIATLASRPADTRHATSQKGGIGLPAAAGPVGSAGSGGVPGAVPGAPGMPAVIPPDPCSTRIVGSTPTASRDADSRTRTRTANDWYPSLDCIALIGSPDVRSAHGVVELSHVRSPFGVAVSPAGSHRYELTLSIEGLPEPATLGPYTTYVAWATTPLLDPMVRLGVVRNGRTRAGPVALDKFLVLVTAERSAKGTERRGRIVMRGYSPSMRMEPHDLPAMLAIAAGGAPADHAAGDARHEPAGARAAGGKAADDSAGSGRAPVGDSARSRGDPAATAALAPAHGTHAAWHPPPMHPAVPMPPGLMHLRPDVSPFLPGADVDPATLPAARPREVVPLEDGDTLHLTAGLVRRTINGRTFTMYGFNGQYPGPLIRVEQRARIVVVFHNEIGRPTAVHWHGIRLDNRYDGVPGLTQAAVAPGDSFVYHVRFPDAGIYWYHPHHREDIQQDLGLYGNLLVDSPEPDYYNPVNVEQVLILDDLLIDEAGLFPYGRETATHALMGRFGNVLLVNGEPAYELEVKQGAVVRFFLTNVSNTRVFNLSFGGAAVKVVGSDVSRFEREEWVENIVIAPAQRYIVEVLFDEPGELALTNRVHGIDHIYGSFFPEIDTLGVVTVAPEPAVPDRSAAFTRLREHADVIADIARYRPYFDRPPDRELVLTIETGELPFPLEPLMASEAIYFNPVEWTGTMPVMNWAATANAIHWTLREPATGRENMEIAWRFDVGDVVKIRFTNDRRAIHAMQHPIHLHGQRFLVLARDGVPNDNLVWKDTALLPVGSTTDLLVEMSNPGDWMLHCHIAEHLEAGMKMVFTVEG